MQFACVAIAIALVLQMPLLVIPLREALAEAFGFAASASVVQGRPKYLAISALLVLAACFFERALAEQSVTVLALVGYTLAPLVSPVVPAVLSITSARLRRRPFTQRDVVSQDRSALHAILALLLGLELAGLSLLTSILRWGKICTA